MESFPGVGFLSKPLDDLMLTSIVISNVNLHNFAVCSKINDPKRSWRNVNLSKNAGLKCLDKLIFSI